MQLKGELWKKMIAVVILLVTFPFGLEMVCWGLVVYSFVDIYIMTHFVRKVSCLSLMNELKSIMPIFACFLGGSRFLVRIILILVKCFFFLSF